MSFRSINVLVQCFNRVPDKMSLTSPLYTQILSRYVGTDYKRLLKDADLHKHSTIPILIGGGRIQLFISRLPEKSSHHLISSQHIKLLEGRFDIIKPNMSRICFKEGCFTINSPHLIANANCDAVDANCDAAAAPAVYLSLYTNPQQSKTLPLL